MWPELTRPWSEAVAVGGAARRRRADRPRRHRDHAGRAVAVGGPRARCTRRSSRRSGAASSGCPATDDRAALPGAAEPGQRALLRRVVRRAPGARRRGAGDGTPPRRRRRCCSTPARSRSPRCGGRARRRGAARAGRGVAGPRRAARQRARRASCRPACARSCYGELGRPAEMFAAAEVARREAERLRIPYGLLVIDNLLAAVAGDGRAVRRVRGDLRADQGARRADLARPVGGRDGRCVRRRSPPGDGDAGEAAAILESMEGGPFPISATVVAFLWRSGQEERRAGALREPTRSTSTPRTGSPCSTGGWPPTSRCTWRTRPWPRTPTPGSCPSPGAPAAPGSGNALRAGRPLPGRWPRRPAATVALAATHADDAERLCAEWQIPLAAQWLRDQRDRYGF